MPQVDFISSKRFCATKDLGELRVAERSSRRSDRAFGSLSYQTEALQGANLLEMRQERL
jgi:hypothetical protein